MTRKSRKYVLDTQLFIHGFHDRSANESLQQFHRVFAPFEYLSVIVAQELRSGVQRPQDRRALERHVLNIFERANRTITPSANAWHRSGDLLAEMARKQGWEIARVPKAFANDILLALSCREAGCVLVTDNDRDFQLIRRFVQFEFTQPWPGGQARWACTAGHGALVQIFGNTGLFLPGQRAYTDSMGRDTYAMVSQVNISQGPGTQWVPIIESDGSECLADIFLSGVEVPDQP